MSLDYTDNNLSPKLTVAQSKPKGDDSTIVGIFDVQKNDVVLDMDDVKESELFKLDDEVANILTEESNSISVTYSESGDNVDITTSNFEGTILIFGVESSLGENGSIVDVGVSGDTPLDLTVDGTVASYNVEYYDVDMTTLILRDTVESGTASTPPTYEVDGDYKCVWKLHPEATSEYNTSAIHSHVKLYACIVSTLTPVQYCYISYYNDEGGFIENVRTEVGTIPTEPEYTPSYGTEYWWVLNGNIYKFDAVVTGNCTITATVPKYYDIRFKDENLDLIHSYTAREGTFVTPPEYVRDDGAKYYWHTSPAGSSRYDFTSKIDDNVTLYAIKPEFFTITFIDEDGETIIDIIEAEEFLPINTPTIDLEWGFSAHWRTSVLSEDDYDTSEAVETVTLYLFRIDNRPPGTYYKVTFMDRTGEIVLKTHTLLEGTTASPPIVDCPISHIVSWRVSLLSDEPYNLFSIMEDVTLYPVIVDNTEFANPLYNPGFYFGSASYNDDVVTKFYRKVYRESYENARRFQKNAISRRLLSPTQIPVNAADPNGFEIDKDFNSLHKLPLYTYRIDMGDLTIPYGDYKTFIRNYGAYTQQVPIMDTHKYPNIFARRLVVTIGQYRITNSLLVVDRGSKVYLVIPNDFASGIQYEQFNEMLKTLDVGSKVVVTTEESAMTYCVTGSYDTLTNYSYAVGNGDDTTEMYIPKSGAMNSINCHTRNQNYNTWDCIASYNTTFGPNVCKCVNVVFKNETENNLVFNVNTAFVVESKSRVDGDVSLTFIHQPNRSLVYMYEYNVDTSPIMYLPFDKNPSHNINLNVFEYSGDTLEKGIRLYDEDYSQLYFPNIYDFTSLNINNKNIIVEVIEYDPSYTTQVMHNGLERIIDAIGEDNYAAVVAKGYIVTDKTRFDTFSPYCGHIDPVEFVESPYFGDIRGYVLNKLVEAIISDPSLYKDYLNFLDYKDPNVVTVSGNPRAFSLAGINENWTHDGYIGGHAVVESTKMHSKNADDIYRFDEPHTYIEYRTSGAETPANLFINGKYVYIPIKRSYNGLNYYYLPLSTVQAELDITEEKANLLPEGVMPLDPIQFELYPHAVNNVYDVMTDTVTFTSFDDVHNLFSNYENPMLSLSELNVTLAATGEFVNMFELFDITLTIRTNEIVDPLIAECMVDTSSDAELFHTALKEIFTCMNSDTIQLATDIIEVNLRELAQSLVECEIVSDESIAYANLFNGRLDISKYSIKITKEESIGVSYTFRGGNFKHESFAYVDEIESDDFGKFITFKYINGSNNQDRYSVYCDGKEIFLPNGQQNIFPGNYYMKETKVYIGNAVYTDDSEFILVYNPIIYSKGTFAVNGNEDDGTIYNAHMDTTFIDPTAETIGDIFKGSVYGASNGLTFVTPLTCIDINAHKNRKYFKSGKDTYLRVPSPQYDTGSYRSIYYENDAISSLSHVDGYGILDNMYEDQVIRYPAVDINIMAGRSTDDILTTITTLETSTSDVEPNMFTVNYIDLNGTVFQTQQVEFGNPAIPPIHTPPYGYRYIWSKVKGSNNAAYYDKVYFNMDLYLVEIEIVNTITYYDFDGSILHQDYVEYGKDAEPYNYAIMTGRGWSFDGWFTDFDATMATSFTNITSDIKTYPSVSTNIEIKMEYLRVDGSVHSEVVHSETLRGNKNFYATTTLSTKPFIIGDDSAMSGNTDYSKAVSLIVNISDNANHTMVLENCSFVFNGEESRSVYRMYIGNESTSSRTFSNIEVGSSIEFVSTYVYVKPGDPIVPAVLKYYDTDHTTLIRTDYIKYGGDATPPEYTVDDMEVFKWVIEPDELLEASFTNITKNTQVYARIFTPNIVTFYDVDDVQIGDVVKFKYGTDITMPNVDVVEGFINKWYTSSDATTEIDVDVIETTFDAYLRRVEKARHVITWYDWDLTVFDNDVVYDGDILPEHPEYAHASFSHWATTQDGKDAVDNSMIVTEVVDLYAVVSYYTVIFYALDNTTVARKVYVRYTDDAIPPDFGIPEGYEFSHFSLIPNSDDSVSVANISSNIAVYVNIKEAVVDPDSEEPTDP